MKTIEQIQSDLSEAGDDPQKLNVVIGDLVAFCSALQTMLNELNSNYIVHGHPFKVMDIKGVTQVQPIAKALSINGGVAIGFSGGAAGKPITIGRPQKDG